MQKENPVIKNYILSTEKRILKDNPPCKTTYSEILLYHSLSMQNKDFFSLFLSRK